MKTKIAAFLFLLSFLQATASDTLTIVSEGDNYVFGNYLQMLKDDGDTLSFAEVRNRGGWKELKDVSMLNITETNTTFWIRFNIRNRDSLGLRWMLEFPDGHNSHLQFHEIDSKGKVKVYYPIGLGQPISHRAFDHKNFLYDIDIPYDKTNTYYVKVKSRYFSSYWASVRTTSFLFSYITREYYLIGIFYGILLIMAMYNLLIFAITKVRVYILYVLYVLSCGFYTFSEDLIGFQLLWPEVTFFNHFQFENAPSILALAFTLYSIEFLELKKLGKKFLFALYFIVGCNFLFSAVLAAYIPVQIKALVFITPFATIYYQAFRLYFNKGYKPARFFIIGFSIILVGFFVFVLRTYELLPSTLYTLYIFNFGFVLEVMMFSFALGDKIKISMVEKEVSQQKMIELLEEKERLKDNINKELEGKVLERTRDLTAKSDELVEANTKLRFLTEELNKMNVQLDLDNWNLQKKVKNETKSRIITDKVSYDEFLTIFPNDSICFQYLEELKWKDGFVCKKCGYNSYSTGDKPFSRKCNKCKYKESVTAGTLFHSVKFPLNKAFYITHNTFKESSTYTVEELSEVIDLRKATVWAFRKKVQDLKQELLRKRKTLNSWDDIILE